MTLGLTVSRARKKLGLSQSELALKAGVGVATVQNIERDRANPAYDTLNLILKVLRIRILFESEPVQISWLKFAALGCPLMNEIAKDVVPSHALLLEELQAFSPLDLKEREAKAVAAWFSAIHDHYPSVWRILPFGLRAWARNQKVNPKLRRLALERLGEYL